MVEPVFTDNWVRKAEDHEANWREWTAGMPVEYILEIGSFEGRSALLWRKVLPTARVYCVDVFGGEHERVHPGYEARFDANTRADQSIYKCKGAARDIVPAFKDVSLDIIYIDGDHAAEAVYQDAVVSWPKLAPGGLMIFDDYPFAYVDPPTAVGIDRFLEEYRFHLKLIAKDWQVAVRKHA